MNLEEFKLHLQNITEIIFKNPDGTQVPPHFHITEVAQVHKKFIDCGGTIREEDKVGMQLWESVDHWHRLSPKKLLDILLLSENKLGLTNQPIEIEYQGDTIGAYSLSFAHGAFILEPTQTACLAEDSCGIPVQEKEENPQANCNPGTGCC